MSSSPFHELLPSVERFFTKPKRSWFFAALLCSAWYSARGYSGSVDRFCNGHLQSMCLLEQPVVPSSKSETVPQFHSKPKRVAVLVVGLKKRFHPLTTLQHVVAPAAKAGYEVDYYVMLSTTASKKVNNTDWEAYWYRPVPNPVIANLTFDELESLVIRSARFYGAHRSIVHLNRGDVSIEEIPQHPSWNRWLGGNSSNQTRFIRALHRFKQIEILWNWTRAQSFGKYDTVVLTFEDVYWVDDLELTLFPDPQSIYSSKFGGLCKISVLPGVANDRALVIGGEVADKFLNPYSEYYHNPDPALDAVVNIEQFLMVSARLKGITWRLARKDWFPFFPVVNMLHPKWIAPRLCLRGLNAKLLEKPTGECIHPIKIQLPFCEDYPLL